MKTENQLDEFRKELTQTLKSFQEKYDVAIKLGTFNYDPITLDFTCRLTVKNINRDNNDSIEQAQFEKYIKLFGLEKSDYNREVTLQGKTFKLYGLNPNAPKNSALIRGSDGKLYKCDIDIIKIKWKCNGTHLLSGSKQKKS